MKVTAILTSHDRRPKTVECLASYYAQEIDSEVELSAVLADAGSADGTGEAVLGLFPEVEVLVGDTDLFWAGGMALAEQAAVVQRPDFLLWLNDDVVLDSDALSKLIETAERLRPESIAVGALRDPASGALTYSGVRRRGAHPLRMDLVVPEELPVEVEAFNGNVVLVPLEAARRIGPLDSALVHAAADFDYGLRASQVGVVSSLAPGTVGTCALNPASTPWLDGSVGLRQRVQILLGPKGLPPGPRARYLRRHGGPLWPFFWLLPYLRTAPSILRPAQSR